MLNSMILQGRIVRDIELKDVGGFPMTEFTVAWSEKYKDIEKKCFLRCKAWRSTAEFLGKYFAKGQEIVVEGQLVTEEWDKDGNKQSRTILNVEKVNFCGSKGASTNTVPAAAPSPDDFMTIPDDANEELPWQ